MIGVAVPGGLCEDRIQSNLPEVSWGDTLGISGSLNVQGATTEPVMETHIPRRSPDRELGMRRCGTALAIGTLLLCAPVSTPAENEPTAALVEQLGDRDFVRREAALQKLAECGVEAIDQLVAAAQTESPEVASRAVNLLERLMGSEEIATIDAADQALVMLTDSDRPYATALAEAALRRNSSVREERAVAKIRELGGQVQYDVVRDLLGQPLANRLPVRAEDSDDDAILLPRRIVLKKDWLGGLEGLVHLKKLRHVSNLQLYVVKGCGVPLGEAQSLASVLPGLEVNERGAYLGVTGSQVLDRCQIQFVSPGGPAAKAGLIPGDTVVALDSEPVGHFEDLVTMLTGRVDGDQVTISVNRRGRELDLLVTLEAWDLPPVLKREDPFIPGFPAPPQRLPIPRILPPGPKR